MKVNWRLTGVVDEREGADLAALLDGGHELVVGHAVPDVLDVAHHKVLDKDVVGAAAGRQDVGQVGQLFDHDDRVVERRLQQRRDGVGDEDGDHDGHYVPDLARHLRDDDADRDRVRHARREGRRADQRVPA